MLATPWPEPFNDDEWSFEVKWDGVRALLGWDGSEVRLRSRSGLDMTSGYPELAGVRHGRPLVLDGEIVAFDDSGRPSFERLQSRMNVRVPSQVSAAADRVGVSFVAFDVLHDGGDLTALTWTERRTRLESVDLHSPFVLSEPTPCTGTVVWDFVVGRRLEGMVAKRVDSPYRPGARSTDWRKVTRFSQVRAVVAGFLPGENARVATFGSLLLGLWDGPGLRWIGSVGSGFSNGALISIRAALDEMVRPDTPFVADSELPTNAVWVEPQLVALVQYKEFTGRNRLRGPSFKGFTDDSPDAATWESEGPQRSFD